MEAGGDEVCQGRGAWGVWPCSVRGGWLDKHFVQIVFPLTGLNCWVGHGDGGGGDGVYIVTRACVCLFIYILILIQLLSLPVSNIPRNVYSSVYCVTGKQIASLTPGRSVWSE